jgi:vitamin B12 transporter
LLRKILNTPIMKNILSLCLLAIAMQVVAQQNDSLQYTFPELIIQENRLQLPFNQNSRSVSVLTREQLENLPSVSVAEVLRYVSGVDIRQRGVHGIQADVSIRGGTFDQVLVLINGVKMADPQTGHHSLNLPIDLENVERIEVLKGPGARIFGQNAFAGAINIITKNPTEQFVKIRLQGGDFGLYGARLSASLPTNNARHYVSLARDASSGYRYNTDYIIHNAFYQSEWELTEAQRLQVMAGFTERQFGANGFYASPDFKDQYEAVQTSLLSLGYKFQSERWTITPRAYWRRNQDLYIFVRNNPAIYRNMHIGDVAGAELNANYRSALGLTGIGIDANYVNLRSNNLGDRQRRVLSAFLEHRFLLWEDRLDITPGILFNYFSDFGSNLLPGLDLGYRFSETLKLFANAGYTYRVPTFTDLYYADRANIGNPDLQPEAALSYEAGFTYTRTGWRAQASYFRREGRDLIDWTKAQATDPWQPQNFGRVTMQGWDINADIVVPLWLGRATPVQCMNVGYTYIAAQTFNEDAAFSRYALDNLRHQIIVGLETKIVKKLSASAQYRYNDRVNLPDYNVLDARLLWNAKRYRIFVEMTNVTNTMYTETNLVAMPGRWLRIGADWTALLK